MIEKSGIYCFENIINGKKYIGQSGNIASRFEGHIKDLRRNGGNCPVFQNAWNKYGEENFNFYIIEKCSTENLNDREIFWIKELRSHISEWGYNVSWGGDSFFRGNHHTEEAKRNIAEKNRGLIRTQETKDKMSLINKGKIISEECRKKISNSNKGKKAYNKNIPKSEFEKEKLSLSLIGRKFLKNSSSIYVGVSKVKGKEKWRASIYKHNKCYRLGTYNSEVEAALAYNKKSLELYGENARLNIIEEKEE